MSKRCLCNFFLNESSSYDNFLRPLICKSRPRKPSANWPRWGNSLHGYNLVDPHHCFNRTTCTRRDSTEIHSPNHEVAENRPSHDIECFSFHFLRSCVPLHLSGSSTRTCSMFQLLRCPCERSPTKINEFGSTHSLNAVSSIPSLHSLWQQDPNWCSSTSINSSSGERYPSYRAFCVGSSLDDAKIHATSLKLATSSFD